MSHFLTAMLVAYLPGSFPVPSRAHLHHGVFNSLVLCTTLDALLLSCFH